MAFKKKFFLIKLFTLKFKETSLLQTCFAEQAEEIKLCFKIRILFQNVLLILYGNLKLSFLGDNYGDWMYKTLSSVTAVLRVTFRSCSLENMSIPSLGKLSTRKPQFITG